MLDEDGNLLFHTNKEWKKHKKALKKKDVEVAEIVDTPRFKAGDNVQIVKHNNTEHWFDLEEVRVIGTIISLVQDWEDPHMSEKKGYIVKLDGYSGIYDGNFIFHEKHLELVESAKGTQKPSNTLRTEEDYRNLSPDTMIEVVIDGHRDEVPLADILILKHVVGKCNGSYLDWTYSLLKNFDGDIGGFDLDFIDIRGKIEPYLKRYFNK